MKFENEVVSVVAMSLENGEDEIKEAGALVLGIAPNLT